WINRMLMRLKDSHQPFLLIRKQPAEIQDLQSVRSPKYMIIYACYLPVLDTRPVRIMGWKLLHRQFSKWWIGLWNIRNEPKCKFLLLLFLGGKGNMLRSWRNCSRKAMFVSAWMVRCGK